MAEMSDDRTKLVLKMVYFGPALSGKTTNLTQLHQLLRPELRGDMMVLETQGDRTLFFDLFPVGFRAPSGLLVKCKMYTVPGQVQHDSTRKAVLSRSDGVIFVADSQPNQGTNNSESFANLAANLGRLGRSIETMPVVVQFNKRDLPGVVTEEELDARWAGSPWHPLQLASALQGKGVVESFQALLRKVHVDLDEDFGLQSEHRLDAEALVRGLCGSA